jgi:hypothetical protein
MEQKTALCRSLCEHQRFWPGGARNSRVRFTEGGAAVECVRIGLAMVPAFLLELMWRLAALTNAATVGGERQRRFGQTPPAFDAQSGSIWACSRSSTLDARASSAMSAIPQQHPAPQSGDGLGFRSRLALRLSTSVAPARRRTAPAPGERRVASVDHARQRRPATYRNFTNARIGPSGSGRAQSRGGMRPRLPVDARPASTERWRWTSPRPPTERLELCPFPCNGAAVAGRRRKRARSHSHSRRTGPGDCVGDDRAMERRRLGRASGTSAFAPRAPAS